MAMIPSRKLDLVFTYVIYSKIKMNGTFKKNHEKLKNKLWRIGNI